MTLYSMNHVGATEGIVGSFVLSALSIAPERKSRKLVDSGVVQVLGS